MKRARLWLAALACIASCPSAQADGSRLLSEGDVAEQGDCELEAAGERQRLRGQTATRQTSLRLACGIGWQTELAVTVSRRHGSGAGERSIALEGKTTLSERDDERIGWALAVAVGAEHVRSGSWRHSEHSVTLEATYPLSPTWLVEAKLGAQRERQDRRDSLVWAVAAEHALSDRVEVRAEIEGDDRGRPLASMALKYSVWSDYLKLRLSYGVRSGPQAERRSSLGLQVEF